MPGSEAFGRAFEPFITLEVLALSRYSGLDYPVSHWRIASQIEVDLVLGEARAAVEVKSANTVSDRHLRGLRAFRQEHAAPAFLVSREARPRRTSDNIDILPWQDFLERLWAGRIVG